MNRTDDCTENPNIYEEFDVQPSANLDQNQCYESVARKMLVKNSSSKCSNLKQKPNILLVVVAFIALFVLGLAALTSFLCVENYKMKNVVRELTVAVERNKQIFNELNKRFNHSVYDILRDQQELAELSREVDKLKAELTSLNYSLLSAKVFNSCSEVLTLSLSSGYYLLWSSSEFIVRVYCNMTLSCGGVTGGWARVAQLDFNDTSTPCPTSLSDYSVNNTNTCRIPQSAADCSNDTYYHTRNIKYSEVCGKINGYQTGTTDGFERYGEVQHEIVRLRQMFNLSSAYLDGVSLTYSRHTRHIWSLVSTSYDDDIMSRCGCVNDIPRFVGFNFSCDQDIVRGSLEPLWDGRGCSEHNEAWFYRQLPETTSEDIEMRVCRDENRDNEDVLIQSVEIYVQ